MPSRESEPAGELRSAENLELTKALADLRARTPARLIVGRVGSAYRTKTQLELREDHAFAVDAVHAEVNLDADLGADLIEEFTLFEVATEAHDKAAFLKRPELGRQFNQQARKLIADGCPADVDLQVVIGDGLSAAAVTSQVPGMLPRLRDESKTRGWSFGQVFFVRHCRVGILNDVGALLRPRVAVLLIGERPGLVTAESLSAYMAFRPQVGHTDAERNLISNIHARGVPPEQAVARILALAEQMVAQQTSGITIKEELAVNLAGKPSSGRLESR